MKIKPEVRPTQAKDNIPSEGARKIMNYTSPRGVVSDSFSSMLARWDKSLVGSGETSFGKWLQGNGETISYDGYYIYDSNSSGRSSGDNKFGPQATSVDFTAVDGS